MIFAEGTVLKPKSWFTLYNHNSYIPIGDAIDKIRLWEQQGANIVYCTSRKRKQADDMAQLLKNHGFSGAWQMCITKVKPEIRVKIKSIVVPEFGGIDQLPDDLKSLI